jgi:serine/threonine protein phosphatase 1
VLTTIDELLDFRRRILGRRRGFVCDVAFLRGTQEEMWQKLLQLQFAPNPAEVLQWMIGAGIEQIVRAYGGDPRQGFAASRDGPRTISRWTGALRATMNERPGHTSFFTSLKHAALTEERELLFVHAAIDPTRPLASQADAFWWGRADILGLAAPFDGFRRVVRGFDADRRGLVESSFSVSIDSGAGQGGPLTAACFGLDGAVLDRIDT